MIAVTFRPLDPTRWPGPPSTRRSPQFRSTWSQTLGLLDHELRAIRAKDVIIEAAFRPGEIRNDGWPRADAKDPGFPGVMLSFESMHGPLRYLTDVYSSGSWYDRGNYVRVPGWQANLRAIALSLEALRAVDRHGVSRHGEQYQGWQDALPPGRPMPAAMTVEDAARLLGLDPDDYEPNDVGWRGAVTIAFRLASKEHHPDAGGDPETFRRLAEARDLLKAQT